MATTSSFETAIAEINDILCAINLLNWDARTHMPASAAHSRGRQIATLTGIARDRATCSAFFDAMDEAAEALETANTDDIRRRALADTRRTAETLRRIPERVVTEAADLKTRAQAAWAEARAGNDFKAFVPWLRQTVTIQRIIAEGIGYVTHPYDALLGQYEPGMTLARLAELYAALRAGLKPLLEGALAAEPPGAFLTRAFPIDAQRRFAMAMAGRMGFDFSRGRLDDTVHPFEISMTHADVRLTARFSETWLPGGLFALWHEAGHGLYEQGVDPAFTRSAFTTDLVNLYAVGGTSFAMHESQSRLLENRLGRSQRFWQLHYAELRQAFPNQLADVAVDEFWCAVNAARPSLIRVEADELTYDFHIMLRTDIEAALISGDLAVEDLPAAWAERIRADLGLEVPSDREGVLQDVHWSCGMVGSFPTYTLGNIMGAQLFAAARNDAQVSAGLEAGYYRPLAQWLNGAVHRHGRSLTSDEILMRATGRSLDLGPYLAVLGEKVEALVA